MKKTILPLLIFTFICTANFAQEFIEDFDDGSFTDGPVWGGDTDDFTINSGQLELAASSAGFSYLSTPASTEGETVWEFYFSMDFNPSGNNNLQVFLNSSNADFTGTGYYLQIGESGSDNADALELVKTDGNNTEVVLRGTDGTVASDPASRVRVTRDATGNWEILADHTGGTNFVSEGTANDNTYPTGNFFGFLCEYTGGNVTDAFFFDDISINPIVVAPPEIQEIIPISNTALDVYFNEPVALPSASIPANYTVSGIGNPANAQLGATDATLVHLTGFSPPFSNNQTYTLEVTGVQDLAGDASNDSETFTFLLTEPPAPFDILINEFMAAKNTDLTGLQNSEYVELYNRSNKFINLNNIKYSAKNTPEQLPDYRMAPGEYVILTNMEYANFFSGAVFVINNVSLTDGGDDILLEDLNGQTIHRKIYTTPEVAKGISTELVNPESYCLSGNWRFSTDPLGGTPGRENSQFSPSPDQAGPELICANTDSQNTLRLVFNEILDESAADAFYYTVNNNIGSPANAALTDVGDEVILDFNIIFEQDVIYEVSVSSDVYDCTGINFISTENTAQFSFSEVNAGDLIINEILYDAPTGGVDFIEIYNNSEKILLINGLQIHEQEEDTFRVANIEARCPMLPEEYIAFSLDPADTRINYPLTPNPEGIRYAKLPAFDDGSIASILGAQQLLGRDTIDKFIVDKDYHNPLVDITKGVSLERIDFDAPTQDPNNWQSAAESAGWATPAYENSQRYTGTGGSSNDCVTITEEIFSPDGDGYQDFLRIDYDLDAPGYIANVRIFDARGRQIKQLINNQFLEPQGFFRWNGDTDEGLKARLGIYIVWVELFDVNGNVTRCKNTCVVAGQL